MRNSNSEVIRYLVQPYDSLVQIAQRFNTNIYEIMDINRSVDFNNLYVGQNIFVPVRDAYSMYSMQQPAVTPAQPAAPAVPPVNQGAGMQNAPVAPPKQSLTEQSALSNELRMLWEQQVYWTRLAMISIINNLPDLDVVTRRLLRNPRDFADLLEQFYGRNVADRFDNLFTTHLTIASDLVKASKEGNTQQAAEIEKRWYANADEIAAFLASINPYWSRDTWQKMLHDHLSMTKTEAVDLITKQYQKSVDTIDEIEWQALGMADEMQQGLARQFFK